MRLRLRGPEKQELEVQVEEEPLSVGRASDNDVVLDERTVSRNHCTLSVNEEGGLVIEDTNSRYGTFHNGNRVREPATASPGDVLMIGAWEVGVFEEPPEMSPELAVADTQPELEVTMVETPLAARKTRVMKVQSGRQQTSPGYVILLITLGTVAAVLLAWVLVDSLG